MDQKSTIGWKLDGIMIVVLLLLVASTITISTITTRVLVVLESIWAREKQRTRRFEEVLRS